MILSRCLRSMSLATPQALHPVKSVLLRACRQAQGMLSLCWGRLRSQSSLHTPIGSRSCFLFHLAEKSVFIYREVERVAHGINTFFFFFCEPPAVVCWSRLSHSLVTSNYGDFSLKLAMVEVSYHRNRHTLQFRAFYLFLFIYLLIFSEPVVGHSFHRP